MIYFSNWGLPVATVKLCYGWPIRLPECVPRKGAERKHQIEHDHPLGIPQ